MIPAFAMEWLMKSTDSREEQLQQLARRFGTSLFTLKLAIRDARLSRVG